MQEVKIGRNKDNHIVFEHDFSVSRVHATIFFEDEQIYIIDHNSGNGTFVNGNRVEGKMLLASNDIIKVGNSLVPWSHYIPVKEVVKEIENKKIEKPIEKTQAQKNQILPGAGTTLTLGILSIVLTGIIGLILGIIGLVQVSTAEKMLSLSPNKYTLKSKNQLNAGKVCCIIGISISGLVILVFFMSSRIN